MVTLLLTFFVMLLSFSSIQESKFQEAVASLKGAFGVLQDPSTVVVAREVQQPQAEQAWQEMMHELQRLRVELAEQGLQDDLQVVIERDGISIQLSTPMLFRPARADLRQESLPILDRLAAVLATRRHAAAMLALPELYRRALFRKDTPFIQGVPVTYLDPGENDAADSIVAWLKNAQ